VGLYLDPPERAVVLCVDEKSQIQAAQPLLPGPSDDAGPPPNDAATTTYAMGPRACSPHWDMASGKVIGSLHRRHRAAEFKKFLIRDDQEVPDGPMFI